MSAGGGNPAVGAGERARKRKKKNCTSRNQSKVEKGNNSATVSVPF